MTETTKTALSVEQEIWKLEEHSELFKAGWQASRRRTLEKVIAKLKEVETFEDVEILADELEAELKKEAGR